METRMLHAPEAMARTGLSRTTQRRKYHVQNEPRETRRAARTASAT